MKSSLLPYCFLESCGQKAFILRKLGDGTFSRITLRSWTKWRVYPRCVTSRATSTAITRAKRPRQPNYQKTLRLEAVKKSISQIWREFNRVNFCSESPINDVCDVGIHLRSLAKFAKPIFSQLPVPEFLIGMEVNRAWRVMPTLNGCEELAF